MMVVADYPLRNIALPAAEKFKQAIKLACFFILLKKYSDFLLLNLPLYRGESLEVRR